MCMYIMCVVVASIEVVPRTLAENSGVCKVVVFIYVCMDGWMDECMYVCMYVSMYVYIYVCIYVCMYVFMYI
jgi:hypothetical protein